MTTSSVLNFAYAEALELRKDKEGVHTTFNNLLKVLCAKLEVLETKIQSANSSPPPPPPPIQNHLTSTPSLTAVAFNPSASFAMQPVDDRPPHCHQYHDIDTIAARDLGAIPSQTSCGSSNSVLHNETSSGPHTNLSNQVGSVNASPDYRRRDDRVSVDYSAGHK